MEWDEFNSTAMNIIRVFVTRKPAAFVIKRMFHPLVLAGGKLSKAGSYRGGNIWGVGWRCPLKRLSASRLIGLFHSFAFHFDGFRCANETSPMNNLQLRSPPPNSIDTSASNFFFFWLFRFQKDFRSDPIPSKNPFKDSITAPNRRWIITISWNVVLGWKLSPVAFRNVI